MDESCLVSCRFGTSSWPDVLSAEFLRQHLKKPSFLKFVSYNNIAHVGIAAHLAVDCEGGLKMDDDLFDVFNESAPKPSDSSKKEKKSKKRSLSGEVKRSDAPRTDAEMTVGESGLNGANGHTENGGSDEVVVEERVQKRQRLD